MPKFLPKLETAVLAILSLSSLSTPAKINAPHYPVQPIGTAPVIDGKLDDACWKQLPAVGAFVTSKSHPALVQTTVQIGYDDQNLYIAARMEEPEMGKVKADVTKHDGGVFQDDDLEIYLAADGKTTPFFIFRINSLGTTEESSMDAPATSFNAPWQGKVNREANAWTAEIAIPFSSLNAQKPKPDSVWLGNIARNRVHAGEASTWSKTDTTASDTFAFGELCFLDKNLLNEFHVTSKDLPNGNLHMRIEGRGRPAAYKTRIVFTDGPGYHALTGEFQPSPYKVTGSDYSYAPTGSPRITVMPELTAGADNIIFRGEPTVEREVDELSVLINGIAKSLAAFPPEQAPPSFRDLAPTWTQRLDALQKKPELIPALALQQEIRAAQWARGLPAGIASQSVLLFPTNPFVEINYDSLPDPAVVGAPVTLQAMRGEYTPACVNVLPMDASRNLLVSVDDLKGPDGATLPSSTFDLRVLKGWYRNGHGGFQDPAGLGVWENELLVKDDGMISSDPTIKRNTIHYTKDATTLLPVKIDRFQTRQFWLTAHVPARQAPGLYTGKIQVSADGQAAGSIPFQVRVLPLNLEKGKFEAGMYYLSELGVSEKQDRWYEADLKSMVEHGFTNIPVYDAPKDMPGVTGQEMVNEWDFAPLRRGLELRKKYGLTGRTALMPAPHSVDLIHRLKSKEILDPSIVAIYKHNYQLFGKTSIDIAKELGFKKAFRYGMDEPGYDATGEAMILEKTFCSWNKEVGVDTASAITISAGESIKDILKLPILDLPTAIIGPDRRKLPFKEAWLYWHPSHTPTYDRLMSGLCLWYGGYTGAYPWVYKGYVSEWDDWFKSPYGYGLQDYVFPGDDGPVPTRQYEGFREGVNDTKYLEMLNNRVQALAGHQDKLDADAKTAWKDADQLLNHAPAEFQGVGIPLADKVDGKMLGDFRAKVADLLLKLDAAAQAQGVKL